MFVGVLAGLSDFVCDRLHGVSSPKPVSPALASKTPSKMKGKQKVNDMRAVLQPSDFRAFETFIASLMLLLFAGTQLHAQSSPGAEARGAAQTPAAWVYVANASASGSTNEITGFTAAANGSLTPI